MYVDPSKAHNVWEGSIVATKYIAHIICTK